MIPIVTPLVTGLDPLWNLHNVIIEVYDGQFNQTQRLIQTSGFHGFYGFLLKLPEKWFRFRFRFTK